MRVFKRGLGRRDKLGYHLFGHLPEERQVLLCMLMPNVLNKRVDTLVKVLRLDLFELSRRLVLVQGHSLSRNNFLGDLSQFPLSVVSPSLQVGDLHQGVLPML